MVKTMKIKDARTKFGTNDVVFQAFKIFRKQNGWSKL